MFFVPAPAQLPTKARRLPARCPPSMIRAPPSRPMTTTIPTRVVPPSTKPMPGSSTSNSSNQAPQVTVAAAAVRAAAAATAAAAAAPSSVEAPVAASSSVEALVAAPSSVEAPVAAPSTVEAPAASDAYTSAKTDQTAPFTREEAEKLFISRRSGRNKKYIRNSIENDRPLAGSIAHMADMDAHRREFYFTNQTNSALPLAVVAPPPTRSNPDTRKDSKPAITPVKPGNDSDSEQSKRSAKNADSSVVIPPTLRSRPRGRPKRAATAPGRSQPGSANGLARIEGSYEEYADTASASTAQQGRKTRKGVGTDDGVRSYLSEIGEVQLLDADSEITLARQIAKLLQLERLSAKMKQESGRDPSMEEWAVASGMDLQHFRRTLHRGLRAKEHMVAANLRLVVSIAKKYLNRGLTFQDLIQEGSVGLIRGAEKFDGNKGFKFSTYATWWIRQAITRAIADHSRLIRLPVHVNDTISSISKATKILENELGRPPSEAELAQQLRMTVDKLRFIMKSSRATISLETPISRDGKDGANLGAFIVWDGDSPEQTAEKSLLREDLENLLNTLTPREKEVVRMRYGFDDGRSRTLEEIGARFAVTRERIRQIEAKALRKLRHPNRNAVLREYIYEDM